MKIKFSIGSFFSKGFTLIELLIVIAILGVLAGGILVAIDPIDKINQANDSKVQNDVSAMGRASDAYAITHGGFYPSKDSDLTDSGELRRLPVAPKGYINYKLTPTCDTSGCTRVRIGGELKSKNTTLKFWNYDSESGIICKANAIDAGCPAATPTPKPT